MKNRIWILLLTVLIGGVSACKKDKLKPINQEELITSVIIALVDSASGIDTVRFTFRDLDGEGGSSPIITSGILSDHTTYDASVLILDESQVPVAVVSDEILEEGTDHQFFYQPTPGSLISYINYLDFDSNGKPLGLSFRVRTGETGTGNFTLILRHLPDKSAANVSHGDLTNAGGETDVEVTYPLTVL